jgi:hypothetical protein
MSRVIVQPPSTPVLVEPATTTVVVQTAVPGPAGPPGSGLADPGSNGVVVRTAEDVTVARTITAGTNVSVSNGSGVSGNPTINVADATDSVKGVVELATDGENAASKVVQGNDSRLSNARTPASHASSHQHGGSDEVATATPGANAIPKAGGAGTLAAGWLPAPTTTTLGGIKRNTGSAGQYVNGIDTDGSLQYGTPAGGGGVSDGDKGDITVSSSGTVWTIDNSVVTNFKLADMANFTIKGRATSGTGVAEDLSASQVRTILNVADGANNYTLPAATTTVIGGVKRNTGSAGQYVNGIDTDGSLQYGTPAGGVSDGDKGDIAVSASGATWTIDNNVVDNAKAADMAAWTVKVRNNSGSGDPQDVVASDLTEETTPAAGDFLLGWESGGALRKFDIGDLPSGGGGNWSLLSTTTISGTPGVVDIPITGANRKYMIELDRVYPATNGYDLRMRTSTDGGSTFADGTNNYYFGYGPQATYAPTQNSNTFCPICPVIGNTKDKAAIGRIYLHNPHDTDVGVRWDWEVTKQVWNSANVDVIFGTGYRAENDAVDTLRFFFDVGNIGGGVIRLFGWTE